MHRETYHGVELRVFGRHGTDADYRVELRVPGNRDFPPGTLPADLPERLRTCADTATYGRVLGQALFAGEIGWAYREVRSRYHDGGVRLRLQLDPQELHPLRWESLYHPVAGGWQSATISAATLLSRYVPADYWGQPAPLYTRPLRILVVLSSPRDAARYNLAPLDTTQWQCLFTQWAAAMPPTVLASGTSRPPTLANLRAALDEGYPLIHFVAHGSQNRRETGVYLEDAAGNTYVATTQELVEIFHLAAERPRFCFLTACESGAETTQVDFLALGPTLTQQAGIPAVIAMADRIGMSAAQTLTAEFYPRLLAGGVVDTALQRARAELRNGADWDVPVLFSRLPDNRLLGDPADLLELQRDIQHHYGRMGELERTAAGQGVAQPERTTEMAYERARIQAKLAEYTQLAGPELPRDLAEIAGKVLAAQPVRAPRIPEEQILPRYRGLIVLIGRGRPQEGQVWNPYQDAAWAAIQYHRGPAEAPVLEHCWLIATPGEEGSEPQAKVLEKLCAAHQVIPHVEYVQPFEAADTFAVVQRIYTEAAEAVKLSPAEIMADFTGGTKPMSAGMLLACARRWPLQYMEGRRPGLASLPRRVRIPE